MFKILNNHKEFMLKQSFKLEVVKGDRAYQLDLPINSPLGEVSDVLYEMRSFICNKIYESQKSEKPPETEQQKVE